MVQSVVSCVKLFCERMSFIEPPEVTDAVFNLGRACKAASQPDIEASSLFSEVRMLVTDNNLHRAHQWHGMNDFANMYK